MRLNPIKNESDLATKAFFPVGVGRSGESTVTFSDGEEMTVTPSKVEWTVVNKLTGHKLFSGSDRYGLLKHEDFINRIESNLADKGYRNLAWAPDLGTDARKQTPCREFFVEPDGGTLRARYFLPSKDEVGSGDKLGYCLDAWNSMNGKSREWVRMGAYRFVCSNGMIGFTDSVSFSKKHTKGNFPDDDIRNHTIKNQFDQLWTNYSDDLDVYRVMDSQVITKQQLESIIQKLPLGNSEKQRKNNHFDGVRDRFWQSQFDESRVKKSEFTLWDVFNATTEHLTHTVERDQGKIENAHRLQGRVAPFFKDLSDGLRAQKPLAELLA